MLIPDDPTLQALLKRLHLAYVRRNWSDVVDRAEREQWSYRDFLAILAAEEVAHRAQTGVGRRTRQAHFPFFKTIEDFDFTHQTALRLELMGSFLAPELVPSGRNLVLQGRPGRGKTHLAIAIAHKAILHGYDALFMTAAELIEDLCTAADAGGFQERLKRYISPGILVVDEVGYLTLRANAANVLYHVVNKRYLKRKPILFTTNKPLTEWGRVLHDPDLAEAILDRVLHNGRLIVLDGPSVRNPKHEFSPDGPPSTARISGISAPEFAEPTSGIEATSGVVCAGDPDPFAPTGRAVGAHVAAAPGGRRVSWDQRGSAPVARTGRPRAGPRHAPDRAAVNREPLPAMTWGTRSGLRRWPAGATHRPAYASRLRPR